LVETQEREKLLTEVTHKIQLVLDPMHA
jgi:hypothetical protein